MAEQNEVNRIKLIIPEGIKNLMEERHILEEDIQLVISYAEETGNKILIHDTGHYMAYHRPVRVTYWVEYLPQDNGFMIYNTYSHRMDISGEVKA